MGKVYIGNEEVSPLLVRGGTTDGLTKAQADKLYVGKTDASNTYLKKTDANSTYVTKTDANNTYLKTSEADNKLLPSQNGNSGKFLSTNGSTAVWVDAPSGGGGDGLAGRAPSGGIIVGADADASKNGVAVGDRSRAVEVGVAVGVQAFADASYSTAIGPYAQSNASDAIQIGWGQNDEASTLKVGLYPTNYTLMTSDGFIPSDRLASNNGKSGQVLTLTDSDSGTMEWVTPTGGNGGISSINHDNTLIGDGSEESPLGVNQDALEDTVIVMEW